MKAMKALFLSLACVTLFAAAGAIAGTLTGTGTVRAYTLERASYPGSQTRQYKVYVPRAYDGSKPVPMVFALHGCAMTNDDALDDWNWDLVADRNDVIVVFPFVTRFTEPRSRNCWGYWFDAHIHEGRGEVEDLHRMARQVEKTYRIDPERRYIIGFSSGGGMAVDSAIAYNEYWAAVASVEGLPYGDWPDSAVSGHFKPLQDYVDAIRRELDDQRTIPLLVVNSRNDEVVRLRAAELIRDAHLTVFGGERTPAAEENCSADGISCVQDIYKDRAGKTVVETVFYDGAVSGTRCGSLGCGHYYSGADDDPKAWAYSRGPSVTRIAWDFFSRQTFSGDRSPAVRPSSAVKDSGVRVTGSATDPDSTAAHVRTSAPSSPRPGRTGK
jgi:poly(hydroxyalkanoate) depolymerase family esterase